MPADEEMSLIEAARRLGIAPGTLRAQHRLGRLVTVKKGRDLFVQWSEIQRYLASRKHVGGWRKDILTDAERAERADPGENRTAR